MVKKKAMKLPRKIEIESRYKVCALCLKEIDTEMDSYARLTDYKDGKLFMEKFYHNNCWNNRFVEMRKQKEMIEMGASLLRRSNKLLTSIDGGGEEVVEWIPK